MSAALPHDLINFSHTGVTTSANADNADLVYERYHILHTFWNVHFVRHKVSRHVSDARSCNLFWRVWSSSKLSRSISTSTLTSLWNRCQTEQDLFPLRRLTYPDANVAHQSHVSVVHPSVTLQEQSPRQSGNRVHRSQPTAQAQEDMPHSTTRGDVPRVEKQVSSMSSNEPEDGSSNRSRSSRGTGSRSTTGRGSMTARDKPVIKGRLRPAVGRRKSSQIGKPSRSPPGPDNEPGNEVEMSRPALKGATVFALASPSSWEDEPSTSSSRPSPRESSPSNAQLVIDKDFRGKFVERIASSTNIAGSSRMKKTGSIVRFADEQRPSLGREMGTLPTTFEYPSRPILTHRQSSSSVAISDNELDAGNAPRPNLHRTTSSLSMMIQQAQLEGEESGLNQMHNRSSAPKTPENDQKPEEREQEELLAMGRRAGGVQLAPRKSLEGESRYSSPEPEPLF